MRDAHPAPNPLSPDRMTAAERLAEISQILATALIRIRRQKSSSLSASDGDGLLDFSPPKSGRGRKPRCRVGGQ
jgi:hypothetical protein